MSSACRSFLMLCLLTVAACQTTTDPVSSPDRATLATTSAATLAFRQVSAGAYHTCGVTPANRLYCWGYNASGQLGDGTTANRSRPVPVGVGLSFRTVSAGFSHTCAVTTANRVYCWGDGLFGKLGNGSTLPRRVPTPIAGGVFSTNFLQVSAAATHTCGITTAQRAYCWGYGASGRLGYGSTTSRSTPVPVSGGLSFFQLSAGAGAGHTCALTPTYRAYCWGVGDRGQLGNGSLGNRLTPVAVAGTLSFSQISAGTAHTCAITLRKYQAYCWGSASDSQLGDGTPPATDFKRPSPFPVHTSLSFRQVTADGNHTCALTTSASSPRAWCWGLNDQGELGTGSTGRWAVYPAPVAGGLSIPNIDAGAQHTCALNPAGLAYCWGDNGVGQLGDGTTTDRRRPVAVVGP